MTHKRFRVPNSEMVILFCTKQLDTFSDERKMNDQLRITDKIVFAPPPPTQNEFIRIRHSPVQNTRIVFEKASLRKYTPGVVSRDFLGPFRLHDLEKPANTFIIQILVVVLKMLLSTGRMWTLALDK